MLEKARKDKKIENIIRFQCHLKNTRMNKKNNINVSLILGTCIFGILFITFMVEGIDNLTASKEVCFISNVSYPTRYPQSSQEIIDSGDFVNCNCGSKCVSDLGTCVRVITNSSGRMLHNSLPKIEKCTFTQTKCPDSEKYSEVEKSIENAIIQAQPFVKLMNNSEPVECWKHNGELFLKNDKNKVIVEISVTGVLFLISLVLLIVL